MTETNEVEKRETIAEVVATMRRGTKLRGFWRSCDLNEILAYHADRIEAAWKRESAEWEAAACACVSDAVMSGKVAVEHVPVGNAAALREAVVALLDALDSLGCDEATATLAAFVPDMADSSAKCLAAFRKAKDALSAPPRNCDRFNTVREAAIAFAAEYQKQPHPCPDFIFSRWLLATAAEQKGETK